MNCHISVCFDTFCKIIGTIWILSVWDSCWQQDHNWSVYVLTYLFVCEFFNHSVIGSLYTVSHGKHG